VIKNYADYLEKRALQPAVFQEPPPASLGMVIVIPSYQEKQILRTLTSLTQCTPATDPVEVIIVLNDKEQDDQEVIDFHRDQLVELKEWSKHNATDRLQFLVMHMSRLPKKKGGVGLARKLGMDEAVRRFLQAGREGLIVALDADTLIAPNYLQAITDHFGEHPKCPGASIAYAHRLDESSAPERRGIVQYELHLRLFLAMKRWTGFPYAFETIGSAMVVRAEQYCKQGGMNTRKAGEDFYFLNKFIPLGNFGEINNTCVYPSARVSERVPLGRGRAMQTILDTKSEWKTYSPQAFYPLKEFFANINELTSWQLININNENLSAYLAQENFDVVLTELRKNTSTAVAFRKRFFRWFDAFRMMKYLHFCLERGAQKISVLQAGRWYIEEVLGEEWNGEGEEWEQEEQLLLKLR